MSESPFGEQQPPAAPPQFSPDGQWWWTGQQWVPAPTPPAPPSTPAAPTSPASAGAVPLQSHAWDAQPPTTADILLGRQMSPAHPANLVEDERVVAKASIHWWAAYGGTIVALVGGVVIGLLLSGASTSAGFSAFLLFALIAGVLAGAGYIRLRATEFVVTTRRVSAKFGFINRRSVETLLTKVEGISVHQNVIGSWLGFGTIIVHGVGGTKEPIPFVERPQQFRAIFQQQVAAASGETAHGLSPARA